jgi:hypothetical protein
MRPTPPHRGAPGRSGQGRDRRGGTAGEDTIADLAAAVATAGDGTTAIDLTVAQEAAEGIREIEAYLARVA